MMIGSRSIPAALFAGLIAFGAGMAADPPPAADKQKPEGEPFHKELLKIAVDYKAWGRVDDEYRWAPWLCRAPNPGQVKSSASEDGETHGQKLYSLFARERKEYFGLAKGAAVAVGQVVVKQSWLPEEITVEKDKPSRKIDTERIVETPPLRREPKDRPRFDEGDHFYPYRWKGDKVYKAAKQANLFIMMKVDPKTPGTDDGWVYGTVAPDGAKVTSAGKVGSCMKCHREAKSERLFGLAK